MDQAFSLKVTGVAKQVLASDLKPLGHQNLLGGWDVIHADELEIPPEVLLPIAHAQSERVAEFMPAGMEGPSKTLRGASEKRWGLPDRP